MEIKQWAEQEYQKQLDKLAGDDEEQVKVVEVDPDSAYENERDNHKDNNKDNEYDLMQKN